jgi:hypothetical protein
MAVSMALVAFLLLTVLAGPGHGSGSQDEAKALVDKAVAFVKSSGAEKGLEEFNKPKSQFVKGEYYVFVYDLTGTMVAHPMNAKLVGKNLIDVEPAGWTTVTRTRRRARSSRRPPTSTRWTT